MYVDVYNLISPESYIHTMAFKGWDKVKITKESGDIVDGIAPVIISASRSTDIPAFYSQWMLKRLRKGYVQWHNPFNGKPQYISFEKTRLIVFWSKNPAPVFPLLDELNKGGIHYLFHITLNDYEKEKMEPGVPALNERISSFKQLSSQIGKDNVIWRYDPIILTNDLTEEMVLERIERIGDEIAPYTFRLIISFLSLYEKVGRNLKKTGIQARKPNPVQIESIGSTLRRLCTRWGIDIQTCAESVDLSRYGIHNGSCIDANVIANNFGQDPVISSLLGLRISEDLFGQSHVTVSSGLKDSGQRSLCKCIVSKDIGRYSTCPHGCIYCYANTSVEKAIKNYNMGIIDTLQD